MTIEERAEEIYRGNTIEMDAYILGATEQKAIDINNALTAHCAVCEFYNECKKQETLTQSCGSCLFIKSKMEN